MIKMHSVKLEGNTRICCVGRKKTKTKTKTFLDGLLNELINSVKIQRDFWQAMHKMSRAIDNNFNILRVYWKQTEET